MCFTCPSEWLTNPPDFFEPDPMIFNLRPCQIGHLDTGQIPTHRQEKMIDKKQ